MEDKTVCEILSIVAKMNETQKHEFIQSVKELLQAAGASFSVRE